MSEQETDREWGLRKDAEYWEEQRRRKRAYADADEAARLRTLWEQLADAVRRGDAERIARERGNPLGRTDSPMSYASMAALDEVYEFCRRALEWED